MMINRCRLRAPAVAALVLAAVTGGCGGGTGPERGRPTSELHFLRPALNSPPFATTTVSFYAKAGEERSASIFYASAGDPLDSTEFLNLVVPAGSLERRPDGRSFARGDSVLITVTVADPSRLIVRFEPAGLRFSRRDPAELTMSYEHADPDFDGDGDIDEADFDREREFSLWHQRVPGGLWYKVPSAVFGTIDEVEGEVFGFSSYAVAF